MSFLTPATKAKLLAAATLFIAGADVSSLHLGMNLANNALTYNHDASEARAKMAEVENDDGYESDTSKQLREVYENAKTVITRKKERGEKPTFLENLAAFDASQAYEERLEFKQGLYYAAKHPKTVLKVAGMAAGLALSVRFTKLVKVRKVLINLVNRKELNNRLED